MPISRRLFLGGLIAGAPAIVKASSLMPIFVPKKPVWTFEALPFIEHRDSFLKWEEIQGQVMQTKLRVIGSIMLDTKIITARPYITYSEILHDDRSSRQAGSAQVVE